MLERIFAPSRLQFRLRNFFEHKSTDSGGQGADDEIFLSAVGTDSAAVLIGPDHKPTVDLVQAERIGDVSEDRVRKPRVITHMYCLISTSSALETGLALIRARFLSLKRTTQVWRTPLTSCTVKLVRLYALPL